MGFDACPHHVWIDRLGNEIHRPQTESMGFLGGVGVGRYKNNRDVAGRRIRLQPLADFKAVQAWHDHVQQDQIGRVTFAKAQGLFAIGCHEDLIVASKASVHDLNIDRLIVNNQ